MNLVYKETKEKDGSICTVEIELRSFGNNRIYEFSIGGDYIDKDGWQAGGCIHDIIEEFFPEYSIFIPLHLCDSHGVPTYAVGNGMYNIMNMSMEKYCKEYRVRFDEYLKLKHAAEDEDELYFRYLLLILGIEDRWQKEADRAISVLENLTKQKFVDEYNNYNLSTLTDKTKEEIQKKISNGYYSPERINERINERKSVMLGKCREKAIASYTKAIKDAEEELKIMLYVIDQGLPTKYLYYHPRTREAHFYEKYSSTDKYRVTKEQFDEFMKNVDYSKLPEGVTFKIIK